MGSVAPFVGLLGTVVGIIAAFEKISTTGSGGLSSVAGGISEALVVTALGLLIAIPSVLVFNYLCDQRRSHHAEPEHRGRAVHRSHRAGRAAAHRVVTLEGKARPSGASIRGGDHMAISPCTDSPFRNIAGAAGDAPEINVTPLVDVVLVLLIIFMVIAPQLEAGERVELPAIVNVDKAAKLDITTLTVTASGRLPAREAR